MVSLLFSIFLAGVCAPSSKGQLTVLLEGFRSTRGQAWVALYRASDAEIFPSLTGRVKPQAYPIPQTQILSVDFSNLEPGEYAISAYHDENGNGKLDQVLGIGPPREPVGASNNPKGMPNFEKAKVALQAGQHLEIRVRIASLF